MIDGQRAAEYWIVVQVLEEDRFVGKLVQIHAQWRQLEVGVAWIHENLAQVFDVLKKRHLRTNLICNEISQQGNNGFKTYER